VDWAPEPGIRWESGVEAGSVIGVHLIPFWPKAIAYAPNRDEAALLLARALEQTRVRV